MNGFPTQYKKLNRSRILKKLIDLFIFCDMVTYDLQKLLRPKLTHQMSRKQKRRFSNEVVVVQALTIIFYFALLLSIIWALSIIF